MRMSTLNGCAIAALIAISATTARAADLPYEVAPATVVLDGFSWTGAYVGGAIGYAFSDLRARNRDILGGDVFSNKDKVDSVTGSAFVGYNYQFDSLVVGAEADVTYGDFGGKSRACPEAGAFTFSCKANADHWFGTARGRVGVAFDRFLVFGTGGLAIGSEVDFKRTAPVGFPLGAAGDFNKKGSGTRYGYTLGGGVDYAVTDNIILRGEYQYIDFGSEKLNLSNGIGGTQSVKIKQDAHLIRAGVAYKF